MTMMTVMITKVIMGVYLKTKNAITMTFNTRPEHEASKTVRSTCILRWVLSIGHAQVLENLHRFCCRGLWMANGIEQSLSKTVDG